MPTADNPPPPPSPDRSKSDLVISSSSQHKTSPSLLSRFLHGVKDFSGQVTNSLELSSHHGNLIFTPEQIQELCGFIEEAKDNRDRRIPELEGCLEEMRSALVDSTRLCASLKETVIQYEERYRLDEEAFIDSKAFVATADVESKATDIPLETIRQAAQNPDFPKLEAQIREIIDLKDKLAASQKKAKELQEMVYKYETAIAIYKGDKHMLLTEVLTQIFTNPSYRALSVIGRKAEDEESDERKEEERWVEQKVTGCETDFVVPEALPFSDLSIGADVDERDYSVMSTGVKIELPLSQMMHGCWMYKYPRKRFDSLIHLQTVPLSKLTFRFFWFCPFSCLVMWSTKSSFHASNAKLSKTLVVVRLILIKNVVKATGAFRERRRLDKVSSGRQHLNTSGETEILVITTKCGKPLALLPTNASDLSFWLDGLGSVFGKKL